MRRPGQAHRRRPACRASFAVREPADPASADNSTNSPELLKLRPDLLNQASFVNVWLTKLRPGADADWRHDPAQMRAYLDRCWRSCAV